MKPFSHHLAASVLIFTGLVSLPGGILRAESEITGVVFKTITGNVEFSSGTESWQPLLVDSKLGSGSVIRTSAGSTVDFYLNESKTTLRLTPDSKLAIETLKVWHAGDLDVTETELKLLTGGLVGSQRKLVKPSQFQIATPNGVARIMGTEYLVRADGHLTVLKGSVAYTYHPPGEKESLQVRVAAGHSFNSATGTDALSSADYLKSINTDVNAVVINAQVYQMVPATTLTRAEPFVSPTKAVAQEGAPIP